MTSKQKYRIHCEKEPTIPIFSQAWWLDATAGDDWDVVIIESSNEVIASLPFILNKGRLGFTTITQPLLTQNLGPWFKESTAKYSKQLGREKDILQELFSKLPKHDYYHQNWHYNITNWLPLYWKNFQQTTRYTYVINDLSNLEKVWDSFETNIRTDIKKANKKFSLTVKQNTDIEDFIELNEKVFNRQNKKLPYSKELVRSIYRKSIDLNKGSFFIAYDYQDRKHAGVFIVWDKSSAYYILGGGDPELRNSGATSLCLWEAIKLASTVTKKFDFEGSMLEPVERFFRAFGAIQTPYFSITKTNSKVLRFLQIIRSIVK
jgi:lipid II:glycine glycyltransferase (peptidoglycan interpeptide bridge formation enzyme)